MNYSSLELLKNAQNSSLCLIWQITNSHKLTNSAKMKNNMNNWNIYKSNAITIIAGILNSGRDLKMEGGWPCTGKFWS